MTRKIDWKALLDPHATVGDVIGVGAVATPRWIQRAQAQQRQRNDARALGISLDVAAGTVTLAKTGATLPVATITEASVTSEPTRITGALLVGPVGFLGQRSAAYLTVVSTGPVWSIPIRTKHVARARALAAEILTAAHAVA